MGRIIDRRARRTRLPPGNPAYSTVGFERFFDQLIRGGLEFFGLYYGTYRAIVVTNEDPQNEGQPDPQGRLVVRVPVIGDSQDAQRIAYPIVPLAGAGYGFKTLPRPGDQVYVEFENGRVDIPLWKGGWWASGDMPDDLSSVLAHGWFTPAGHQILMVEDDGEQIIRVRHLTGHEIVLDNDGNITISNGSGKEVVVGSGSNEAAALGDTLKGLLEEILDQIVAISVPTGVGPSGPPLNMALFQGIKARLQTLLSQTVKVAK